MPKLLNNKKVLADAESLLAKLAKNKKINKRPEKLTLSPEQIRKNELLKALDDMGKDRELKESNKIMAAIDTIFKTELFRVSVNMVNSHKIGYSWKDLVVFEKEQPNQPVPASTLNLPYDIWLKNHFFNQIWRVFFEFEIYIIKTLNDLHVYGSGFKIYDREQRTWSPIDSKELEILIYEFFEKNKNFDSYELLFRLICMRLNAFILDFNKKNKFEKDQAFQIDRFIFNGKELKLIDEMTELVKNKILLMFPEYKELYEKYLKPAEQGKAWIDKLKGKSKK